MENEISFLLLFLNVTARDTEMCNQKRQGPMHVTREADTGLIQGVI